MFLSFEVYYPLSVVQCLTCSHADTDAKLRSPEGHPVRGQGLSMETNYNLYMLIVQISTGTAHFLSGGLGAFAFWAMAIPADNIKK